MSRLEWCIAAASVAGTSHLAAGKSCEDYHVAEVAVARAGDRALIAAVSDGAGSAPRGGAGAQVICDRWLNRMTQYFAHSQGLRAEDGLAWALDARAALSALATMEKRPLSDYACTFLGVCVLPDEALVVQIGDGAVVFRTPEGFRPAFWPGQGEYANTTAFVTDEDSAERVWSHTFTFPIDEIALFSDGLQRLALDYESQTAFSPFFESMFLNLRGVGGVRKEMSEALAAFLNSKTVNERTDDDKTLVLATRRIGGPPGAERP